LKLFKNEYINIKCEIWPFVNQWHINKLVLCDIIATVDTYFSIHNFKQCPIQFDYYLPIIISYLTSAFADSFSSKKQIIDQIIYL